VRPATQLLRDPAIMTALMAALVGYVAMNLLMTATPLAMRACGLSFGDTAFVIQWHVVGMFLPSFWTGKIIARFGAPRVIVAGVAIDLACIGVSLTGVEVAAFAGGLFLLGLGWNCMFVGATSLLTASCRPAERAKVQGLHDLILFTTVSASALSAGALHELIGWHAMNLAMLPPLLLVLAMLTARPPLGAPRAMGT
jgi:hypothetical protein